jgi:hypothetical protein
MNPIELLPNPDDIGQMEYRAIHTHMKEVLDDCPQEERMELALGILKEFKGWAKSMKKTLKSSSKKSRSKGK